LSTAPIFRGFATWQPQAAVEMMDRQGVATAILSMVIWTGMFAAVGDAAAARRVARSSNEAAAEAIRSHPGRFGGFGRLPLCAPVEILRQQKQLVYVGHDRLSCWPAADVAQWYL
jgi:predicted TIM-barrel fold metal-dependent hydrolase